MPFEDTLDRTKDFSKRESLQEELADIYKDVVEGFEQRRDRDDSCKRFWDIYQCHLSNYQTYNGDSQVFVPAVHDAIEARVQRFCGILFPQTGRHIEVVSDDGKRPYEVEALLNHYVHRTNLRQLVPSLLRAGDVTGQYSLYVDWDIRKDVHTRRVMRKPELDGAEGFELTTEDEFEDVEDHEVKHQGPRVRVLADEDLCVIPPTVDSIEEAEIVAIALRLTKRDIKTAIKDKVFTKSAGSALLDMMSKAAVNQPEPDKDRAKDAGIRKDGGKKVALVYQVWTRMEVDGDFRPVVIHFGAPDMVLGCKLNPYWNNRIPVISAPAKKIAGSFWGMSQIDAVEQLQYQANDAANMGLDSAKYSLMPIVMTDPNKNPRAKSMTLNLAALWYTSPQDTQILQFPALWKDATMLVQSLEAQINQSLGVNAALKTPNTSSRKPSQAQVAQEYAAAIETAVDAVTVVERGILSPLIERFFELDQQFRDEELMVEAHGELGARATLVSVTPQQFDEFYVFRWFGSESTRSVQMLQQQIAGMNILKSIPPQMLGGRRLELGPLVEHLVSQVYGPRLGPQVLVDERHQMSLPPDIENQILAIGHTTHVSPLDNDMEHLMVHAQEVAEENSTAAGEASPQLLDHITAHQKQMQAKAAQAMGMLNGSGAPGPGPRPGAQPTLPRGGQAPPGAIHQDRMQDASMMPR